LRAHNAGINLARLIAEQNAGGGYWIRRKPQICRQQIAAAKWNYTDGRLCGI
jgi:hypothetical protein